VTEPSPATSAASARSRGLLRVTVGVALLVWVVDQLVKYWAVTELKGQPPISIIGDFFTLTFVSNPGAAFSIGGGYTAIFSLLAIAVAVLIVRTATKLHDPLWAIAFGALLGGAVGNLTDRIFREPAFLQGHVVDYIKIGSFPVFNVADMAITLSAASMVLLTFLGRDMSGRAPGAASTSDELEVEQNENVSAALESNEAQPADNRTRAEVKDGE